MRRWLRRLAVFLLVLYIGLCAVIFAIQNSLIFPGHLTQGQPQAMIRPAADSSYELLHLKTADGTPIAALFAIATDENDQRLPDAAHRPTVLYFYGNAMCLADCFDQIRRFRRLGVNIMIPEYVGYGMSGGAVSEAGCYATADAAYNHLLHRSGVDPNRIFAAGWSLGAAAAIDLASRRPVAGVITFSAFTSMANMARRVFPLLPTGLLLRSHFDNLSKISTLTCPLFIAHGRHDQIAPFEMSQRLAAAAHSPLTRLDLDTDHNDLFELGWDTIQNPLKTFLHTPAQ